MDELLETNFCVALKFFQRGEIARAEELCIEILASDPNHASTLNLSGVIASKKGHFEKASTLIQKAIQKSPQKAIDYSYNLAQIAFESGKKHEAALIYKKMAEALQKKKEKEEVIQCLLRAAFILRDDGDFEEAKKCYLQILDMDPHHLSALNDLGLIAQKEDDLEKAKDYFQKALDKDPHYSNAYNNLGLVLQLQNNLEEARVNFERAVELEPHFVEALINLGNAYRLLGKLDLAIAPLIKASEIAPNHSRIYLTIGIIFHRQGLLDDALLHYQRAIDLDPEDREAKQYLALAEQDKKTEQFSSEEVLALE